MSTFDAIADHYAESLIKQLRRGTFALMLISNRGRMPANPAPTMWRPLWPWRAGRVVKARAVALSERLADVAYVARHGIPEDDE